MTADPLFRAAQDWEDEIVAVPPRKETDDPPRKALGDPLFQAALQWEEKVAAPTIRKSAQKGGKRPHGEEVFLAELQQLQTGRNDPLLLAAMKWELQTHPIRHEKPRKGQPIRRTMSDPSHHSETCSELGAESKRRQKSWVFDDCRETLEIAFQQWQG